MAFVCDQPRWIDGIKKSKKLGPGKQYIELGTYDVSMKTNPKLSYILPEGKSFDEVTKRRE